MKKTVCTILAALAAIAAFAGSEDDTTITFKTEGPDLYKDGTTVLNGEFYALVWVANGAAFKGFKADGTLASTDGNALISLGPAASGGRLPKVKATVPSSKAASYANGSYKVVLLDTRDADGSLPVDTEGKRPMVPSKVNGYSVIAGNTTFSGVYAMKLTVETSIAVSIVSEVPAGTPSPVITGIRLENGDGGQKAVLTVTNTVPYLNYCAASVSLGDGKLDPIGASAANGGKDKDAEVEIDVPATGKSGLFKVIRK